MESDNLLHVWQSQELYSKEIIDKVLLNKLENKIKVSTRNLYRKLFTEIFIGFIIYIGAGLLLFFIQARYKEILFAVKIMSLTAMYAVPSTLLLYQSITRLKKIDYNLPLKKYLHYSVTSLNKTIHIYRLAGLLCCLFVIIALFTDQFYLSQPLWLKVSGLIYILIIAIFMSSVLHYQYGKEIKILEKQLLDLAEKE